MTTGDRPDREMSRRFDEFALEGSGRGAATIDPNGYKILSVRLREAEYAGFCEHVRALGLTNNMAMRIAARRIAGFLEIDNETRQHLRQITREIGLIADSLIELNRLALHAGTVDMEALTACRQAFGREFAELDTRLRAILSVSRRRHDGKQLLAAGTAA